MATTIRISLELLIVQPDSATGGGDLLKTRLVPENVGATFRDQEIRCNGE